MGSPSTADYSYEGTPAEATPQLSLEKTETEGLVLTRGTEQLRLTATEVESLRAFLNPTVSQ